MPDKGQKSIYSHCDTCNTQPQNMLHYFHKITKPYSHKNNDKIV